MTVNPQAFSCRRVRLRGGARRPRDHRSRPGRRHHQVREHPRPVGRARHLRQADGRLHPHGHRRVERRGWTPRQADRPPDLRPAVDHPALHPVRDAGGGRGQGRRRTRRHHLRLARGHPPHLLPLPDPLLLQHPLRGRGVRPQLFLHRLDTRADGREARALHHEQVGQEGLHRGRGLQLRPDHRPVGAEVRRRQRRRDRRNRVLSPRRHQLRPDDQEDPGREAGHGDVRSRGRRPRFVLPPVRPGRHEPERADRLDHVRSRQRAQAHLRRGGGTG